MKLTFKDIKVNFAADICGEGQGEAQLHLGEIAIEASPAELAGQTRELVNLVRDMVREARNEQRESRTERAHERAHEARMARFKSRKWEREDDEE